MGNTISAVIITFNEEANIGRCIDSLKPLADEIIVVDCYSTDSTKEICLRKKVTFVENEFLGFANQKNFAASLATKEYILSLDADEYLSPDLTQSLLKVKQNLAYDGYTMNRLSSYAGEWIRTCGWYPDTKLRLWKKGLGVWTGQGIHERVEIEGDYTSKHLEGDLLHHAYDNITQFLEKIQRYSDIYAREHRYKIRSSGFKIFYKTTFAFAKSFFLKRGILDGYKGLLISVCNANFVFYKYSKLREANIDISTSLIISTYNREDALELTLLSVLQQSELPNEIIIADDGSGLETKRLIERYKETFPIPIIHCWHEDLGFRLATIRNKAIAMASCEYVVMIDGDIVMSKHFISSHKRNARLNQFIQGSRVLLQPELTHKVLERKHIRFSFFTSGITNRFNTIHSKSLSSLFSFYSAKPNRIRGANLSFWKDDVIKVNGFNEDFVGWGREDSEFAVRLKNVGIRRKHLKFAGFGYHLYHKESSREALRKNDLILERAISEQLVSCQNGIGKYLKMEKEGFEVV
ncbi:MAG: glycosyltransferase [Cyclobacteriaceae bacterium]